MTPYPSATTAALCMWTPKLATASPPQKQQALTNIVFLGPTRSTHLPRKAAESPSITRPRE